MGGSFWGGIEGVWAGQGEFVVMGSCDQVGYKGEGVSAPKTEPLGLVLGSSWCQGGSF